MGVVSWIKEKVGNWWNQPINPVFLTIRDKKLN